MADKSVVVNVFKDTVTSMSVLNRDNRIWWYTWLASRDRYNAALWNRFLTLASVETDEQQTQSDDSVLTAHIRKAWPIDTRSGFEKISERLKFFRSTLFTNLSTYRRLIAEVLWFLRWSYVEKNTKLPDVADVIIVTQLSPNSFRGSEYKDLYFGPLQTFLEKNGERVFVCGMVQGNINKVHSLRENADNIKADTVSSLGSFIKVTDVFLAIWETIFNKIKIADVELPWGGNSKTLLADDIRNARPDMFHCLMIEHASDRMLSQFPLARVIHTYENNPWEHAVNYQATLKGHDSTGFLHCAVLPSHLKNYIAEEEIGLRPSPKRIVCTGGLARDVFLSLGAHDSGQVFSSCDLRGTIPRDRHPREIHRNKILKALVVLEGLPSMGDFIRFLDEAARKYSEIVFSVRAHPALPLKTLVQKIPIDFHPNGPLIENCEINLLSEIEAADVVIYQGTTVAMTSVYLGTPVIKIVGREPVEDDPLFQTAHLKWRAQNLKELGEVFGEIENLGQNIFEQERDAARKYISEYLAAPTEKNMSVFLKTGGVYLESIS
jgi:hypothetical protein